MMMSLLLLFSLSFGLVSCEKCSEDLHKTLEKSFNLGEKCDECKVLLGGNNLSGFCERDKFFIFKGWKCREEKELNTYGGPLVVVAEGVCHHLEGNFHVETPCFSHFNEEMCIGKSGLGDEKRVIPPNEENGGETEETEFFRRPSSIRVTHVRTTERLKTTKTTPTETTTTTTTETTSTETTPTETTSTETTPTETTSTTETTPTETTTTTTTETTSTETTPTETTSTTEATTTMRTLQTTLTETFPIETSTSSTPSPPTTTVTPHFEYHCEPNEFYHDDHCYFLKIYKDWEVDKGKSVSVTGLMKTCQSQHPKALSLAVETEEENSFVLKALSTIYFFNKTVIFTSGFKENNGQSPEWFGWNLKINETVLNLQNSPSDAPNSFYCINPCQKQWYLLNPNTSFIAQTNAQVVCERPYNPKNTQRELHQRCLELYRNSSCYRIDKHENYCCAKDEHDEIWFACRNETALRFYPGVLRCDWHCKDDGFFIHDRPICRGGSVCRQWHRKVKYVAPINRYALSSCPKPYSGYSSWFCGSNRTFVGLPDYSLCCRSNTSKCKDTDVFLNIWMGCRCKRIVKRTACPPGTLRSEAFVEWYCQANGTFLGDTPDYSNCNRAELTCVKTDRFQVLWTALPGTTARKRCPPSFTGECSWKCKSSGVFEGPEPDCSKCKAGWMNEIAAKIKNHSQHEEIMEIMESYTEKEDLRIGFGHVINLTSQCVTLFKRQINKRDKFYVFDKFLKSYSKILRNIAGDANLWASFSEPCRQFYVDQILKTTQSAAFANLEIKNSSKEHYNATFFTSRMHGLDFFVAYNPPLETNFPLDNSSHSDWHLKIKEINESAVNFAAMGLVVDCSLSSLMFPRGNGTKHLELNAPTVTFTVAAAADGGVVIEPNVVVTISFKHVNRTRFPAQEVIRRRLHAGEYPSGVFNSTLCFYYSDSDWSTEGCSVTYTSRERTNCTCNHLSTIGLLMSIHKYKRNKILEFVSSVSSGITIVSLVLSLLVFHFVDKGSNDRKLIGKNLCMCLLIGHIMLFSVMDKKFINTSDTMCRVYAILLHYVFMAAFAWMFVEGCHLYRMLVLVFDSNIDYRWIYLSIGYGVPLVVVAGTQLVGFLFQEQPYGQDELCWLKTPDYVWAFIGPVIVSTSINFCILIVALKLAISSKRRTEKSNLSTVKVWVKGWISLSTLLGITWLFGLGYIRYNESLVYVFIVFNGLQGFFIFLFRCVFCEQYRTVFVRKFKSLFSNSKSTAQEIRDNARPGTKVFVVSGSKSSSDETEGKDSGYDSKKEREILHQRTKDNGQKAKENPSNIIILTPTMSEDYLRNRMISKNFSARRSKASWLGDSENFPELSYHGTFNRN